jgi:hypothetical protein
MTIDAASSRLTPAGVSSDFRDIARQALGGLALSASFGLAIGARYGVAAMAVHAVGVPTGFAVAAGLAAPGLCIGVAHFDLPIDALAVARAVARGLAAAGRTLAGLAPAALLLTATPEASVTAAVFAVLGLALGSGLGVRAMAQSLRVDEGGGRFIVVLAAFVLLASLMTFRVWWWLLPMLGRGAL